MRRLITTISLTLAVLLGSTGVSFALPICGGSPATTFAATQNWTECTGVLKHFNGGRYEGSWREGELHGSSVTSILPGGLHYVGEYRWGSKHGRGIQTGRDGTTIHGIWRRGILQDIYRTIRPVVSPKTLTPEPRQHEAAPVIAKKSREPSSQVKRELEELREKIARLEKEKKQNQSKQVAKRTPPEPSPPPKSSTSGSGFFISKSGHVLTNQHVVGDCKRVSVGDNAQKQVTADVIETDRRNDLALLKISSLKMASVETKSLIRKLGIKVVPLSSDGLLRSDDVDLGEDVLVAGYPYGEIFSNSIKVTKGIVSANRGLGNDTGQFQMDAAVQPGNSGGPIYDENGNIVGVVVSQLNKMKFAKQSGSMPENVNFGIKASTVRQFLSSSGLTTKWSERSKRMSTKDLARIAQKQTVMVQCHQ